MRPWVALAHVSPRSVLKRFQRVRTPPECRALDMHSGSREDKAKKSLHVSHHEVWRAECTEC
jgi:hypothetical protein